MKRIAAVKQNPEKEVPTEVLADAIVEISKSMDRLKNSRLTDKAIMLLIQHNCKPLGYGKNVGQKEIKAVIDSIASLKKAYVK